METGKRAGPPDLTHFARLTAQPEQYHIFHAFRIIEATYKDAPRMGTSHRPQQDPIRLEQQPELAFPPATIVKLEAPQGKKPGRLTNLFFGLFGPHGPMPLHLTEYARDRQRNHRDPTFVAFANMVTHRLMGLFYRAWSTGQPAPSHDRADDPMARKVGALAGVHGSALGDRDAMPDLAKLHFAGLMSSSQKSPEGLVQIIAAFFEMPVHLREFVGCWLELEPDDRWQLGMGALGRDTSIGDRVWSRGSKFRLHIGPLSLEDYERMLPGSPALARLTAIVRNYIGDVLDWDVNLILKADEVPKPILGQTVSLGHTGWMGERSTPEDADELYLIPPRRA